MAPGWGRLLSLTASRPHVDLDKAEISFGRAASCDVTVPNVHYSGTHCVVSRGADSGGVCVLRNLSSNGTFVQRPGARAVKLAKNQSHELRGGDSFALVMPPDRVEKKFKAEAIAFKLELAAGGASASAASAAAASAAPANPAISQAVSPPGQPRSAGAPGGAPAPDAFKMPAPKARQKERTLPGLYSVTTQELGRGQFATVYKCRSRESGEDFAVKKVLKKKFALHQKFEQNIKKEVGILKQMTHPNIVQVIDVFDSEAELNLVMELMAGGELFDYIIEKGRLAEDASRGIVEQVLQAVSYLHGNGVIHRDLKPENILLCNKPARGQKLQVKLADFGIATIVGSDAAQGAMTYCGTPHYFAPEVHRRQPKKKSRPALGGGVAAPSPVGYGKAADMWSIGVIVYVMLSGRPPFDEDDLEQAVQDGQWSFDPIEWGRVSLYAQDFVRNLMALDPAARLTAEDALAHTWIRYGQAGRPAGEAAAAASNAAASAAGATPSPLAASAGDSRDTSERRHTAPESQTLDLPEASSATLDQSERSNSDPVTDVERGKRARSQGGDDDVAPAAKRPAVDQGGAAAAAPPPAAAAPAAAAAAGEASAGAWAGGGGGFAWDDNSSSLDSNAESQSWTAQDGGVVWLWKAGKSWKRYDVHVNLQIEEAFQRHLEGEGPATLELPGGNHRLHFEPIEEGLRPAGGFPSGCTGMRQTRRDNHKKKRWIKRVAQEEHSQALDDEHTQNMAMPKEERKKKGFLF